MQVLEGRGCALFTLHPLLPAQFLGCNWCQLGERGGKEGTCGAEEGP